MTMVSESYEVSQQRQSDGPSGHNISHHSQQLHLHFDYLGWLAVLVFLISRVPTLTMR
jgi:hypothetical protein